MQNSLFTGSSDASYFSMTTKSSDVSSLETFLFPEDIETLNGELTLLDSPGWQVSAALHPLFHMKTRLQHMLDGGVQTVHIFVL